MSAAILLAIGGAVTGLGITHIMPVVHHAEVVTKETFCRAYADWVAQQHLVIEGMESVCNVP
jgi:hypothetical protein